MELARILKVESVSRLNPRQPVQVKPEQTVAEAVALMRHERVGCVLVCAAGKLLGIFTERDLLRRVLAEHQPLSIPIADVMTADPVTVHPKETIGVAIARMEEGGYRHLPVVGEQAQAVGILSVKRIVHYLVEHFPGTVINLPPVPGSVQQEREGA
jgi:CBS domain-containing protein